MIVLHILFNRICVLSYEDFIWIKWRLFPWQVAKIMVQNAEGGKCVGSWIWENRYKHKIRNTWISDHKDLDFLSLLPHGVGCILRHHHWVVDSVIWDLPLWHLCWYLSTLNHLSSKPCLSLTLPTNIYYLNDFVIGPIAVTRRMEYISVLCWVYNILSKWGCYRVQPH